MLSATPIIVFYLALLKYIIKGIAAGAGKGQAGAPAFGSEGVTGL